MQWGHNDICSGIKLIEFMNGICKWPMCAKLFITPNTPPCSQWKRSKILALGQQKPATDIVVLEKMESPSPSKVCLPKIYSLKIIVPIKMTIWAQVGIPDFQTYPDKNSRHYLWEELQNIKGHPASRRTNFALNQWMMSLFHYIQLDVRAGNASNHFLQRTGKQQICWNKGPFRWCGNTIHPSLGGPKTWGIC